MKTKAVRLYGKNDLRLEEFELPELRDDEILAHVISDSICMSTYKETIQGSEHKRVPEDLAQNPVIVGHEFCGEIVKAGSKWSGRFKEGSRFAIQPALFLKDNPYTAVGYSFKYAGGAATYVIIPDEVMEQGCLLPYTGGAFFSGSLSEPMSCIAGTFHAMYHTEQGSYSHKMGIKEGGSMAVLAAAGPMGLGAVDYAIHCSHKPGKLVVTDIDGARLKRASSIYTKEEAAKHGVELIYADTSDPGEGIGYLMELTGGMGYDDIIVFAPVREVVEMADRLLGHDGCLNFFAGPSSTGFSAEINFYNVHYNAAHIVGTSGGNTEDMAESLELMGKGIIDPASMITHIGGLDCYAGTVMELPKIPGGKKLIYTNIRMELTAIDSLREKGRTDPMLAKLADIVENNKGLWSPEAEKYLLSGAVPI